jgi:hypothetical protein
MLMGPVAMGQLGAVSFNPLNGPARGKGCTSPGSAKRGDAVIPFYGLGRRYDVRSGSPRGLRSPRAIRRAGVPVELSTSKASRGDSWPCHVALPRSARRGGLQRDLLAQACEIDSR